MRIAYFIHGLTNGGAEKVAAKLSIVWSELGHEVVLLTQTQAVEREYEHLCVARECVPYTSLNEEKVAGLKKKYHFDLVVFNDAINDESFPRVFAAFRDLPSTRVAIIIHHTANNWLYTLGNTQELFSDKEYAKADAIICVDKMWALWWHHRGARAFYIPNPVVFPKKVEEQAVVRNPHQLVWVGRLMDWAKQPEKMIAAFVRIAQKIPEARLVMLGSKTRSTERALLRAVPKEMQSRIMFPGFVTDAYRYMRESALHVFTSLTEVTVPQVILEARACGLKTIALDMPVMRDAEGVEIAGDIDIFVEKVVGELEHPSRESNSCDTTNLVVVEKWNALLSVIPDDASLRRFEVDERALWQNEASYNLLFDELNRSQQCFTRMYLPELLFFKRWRTRLSLRYAISKIAEKALVKKAISL